MNNTVTRRNNLKISIVTHSKISVPNTYFVYLSKEFPFDTCTNYVIYVDRYRILAVYTSQCSQGVLGRSGQQKMGRFRALWTAKNRAF